MTDQTVTNFVEEFSDNVEVESHRPRSGWIAGLVFLLLIVIVGLFLVDRLYNPGKFRIEEVEIRGQFERVDPEAVRSAVASELDGNYFSASLEDIEQAISELPWIFQASVRRRWPSTLVVDVDEVQPIAAWGQDRWLNASGDLVSSEEWSGALPVLDGPESMKERIWQSFQEWHGLFAAQGLSLDRLEFDQRELWYLSLSLSALALERVAPEIREAEDSAEPMIAEVTMIVDNSDASARIRRLINALNSQLIAEFPSMRSIDLRYPNGFAIHWVDGAPSPRQLTDSQ